MHGAPVTVHVTSPTSRLFSRIIRVVDIGPLMSSASTTLADKRRPITTAGRQTHLLLARIEHALSKWLARTKLLSCAVIHQDLACPTEIFIYSVGLDRPSAIAA